jgi:hypothetical protein
MNERNGDERRRKSMKGGLPLITRGFSLATSQRMISYGQSQVAANQHAQLEEQVAQRQLRNV